MLNREQIVELSKKIRLEFCAEALFSDDRAIRDRASNVITLAVITEVLAMMLAAHPTDEEADLAAELAQAQEDAERAFYRPERFDLHSEN